MTTASFPCRAILTGILLFGVASCGPGAPVSDSRSNAVQLDGAQRFATGPIKTACTRQRERTVSVEKCGCVQAAADLTLSASEQKRSAEFFADPEKLQKMKLSDTPANERFWDVWAQFADTAEQMCNLS